MKIDNHLLNSLTAQAKESPRLRVAYDLRTQASASAIEGKQDNSQRILNALEPGTVLPIHRHRTSTETITCLRGKCVQYLYDENGNKVDEVLMQPASDCMAMSVEVGQWHRLECLESGTVIFEAKDGAYEPLSSDDIMTID